MEWLFGLAILPILMCGFMCLGGMVLAALGLRRAKVQPKSGNEPASTDRPADQPVAAQR